MTGTQQQLKECKQQNHREDHRMEIHLAVRQTQTRGQIQGQIPVLGQALEAIEIEIIMIEITTIDMINIIMNHNTMKVITIFVDPLIPTNDHSA